MVTLTLHAYRTGLINGRKSRESRTLEKGREGVVEGRGCEVEEEGGGGGEEITDERLDSETFI